MAKLFEHAAEEVHVVGSETRAILLRADFNCDVAYRLANSATARLNDCSLQETELREMARSLYAHAAWIDDTTEEMERLENRIRAWASANPAGSEIASGQPSAALITHYPVSGSLEWQDVAAKLRSSGAAF
ncbi:MAG: hypothetical protein GY723_00750 [bacterium]|nr:hypothetical protein [bacterium]